MNFPRFLALSALALLVPALGGCYFVPKPTPMPTPTPAPTPFGVQFDPKEGSPPGTPLNRAGDPILPDAFRVAQIVSGQEVVLQSVKNQAKPDGTKGVILGAADPLNPVRLAGIVTPSGTQTGATQASATAASWTAGQDLDVEIDPVYPTDTDNKRRVQIFFKGRSGATKDQRLSLNRMMVRSGFAVVDLYSPTSLDQQQWLYDETYAREHNLGLWKTDVFRQLQQRVKLPSKGTGAQSKVTVQLPKPGDAPANTTPGATPDGSPGATPDGSPNPAPATTPAP